MKNGESVIFLKINCESRLIYIAWEKDWIFLRSKNFMKGILEQSEEVSDVAYILFHIN
jgi:hypothetical protein